MRFYIETLGCPKNLADSESLAGILERAGHQRVGVPDAAELLLLNTCGFIRDAKKESIERIFALAGLRSKTVRLVVMGCMAQRYTDDLFEEIPEIDLLMGISEYDRLPAYLDAGGLSQRGRLGLGEPPTRYVEWGRPVILENSQSRFLKISDGCDNHCAYCVIPSIRGRFRSRRIETLIEEAVRMAQTGCLELNIVAQDVTAYGIDLYGKKRLPDLLARLSEIDGLEWIRLFYCYEDKLTAELIECMRTLPKLCHYIDLPIQHINNRILRQMRRRSNRTTILGAIEKLRSAIPDIHIRTSLIAGFPGETEAEFEELADFIKETRFERLGVFAYSEEEGTPAAEMAQLPEEVRTERRDRLMEIQNRISYEQNQAKIGQQFDVLIEAEEAPGVFRGRTQYDAPEIDNEILFEADHRRSAAGFAKIRVTDAYDYDLIGREEESPGESTQ